MFALAVILALALLGAGAWSILTGSVLLAFEATAGDGPELRAVRAGVALGLLGLLLFYVGLVACVRLFA